MAVASLWPLPTFKVISSYKRSKLEISPKGREMTERLGWSTQLCFTVSPLEERLQRHFICVFCFPNGSPQVCQRVLPFYYPLYDSSGGETQGKHGQDMQVSCQQDLMAKSRGVNVVYLRSRRPHAACTHTKNTPGWSKPTSLKCGEEDSTKSCLCRRITPILNTPATSNLTIQSAHKPQPLNISSGLLPDCNHTGLPIAEDPWGLGLWKGWFARNVCVIFKHIFFKHAETEQLSLSVRTFFYFFTIAKTPCNMFVRLKQWPIGSHAVFYKLSFVRHGGIISLPHS